jgi:hypothetical protein
MCVFLFIKKIKKNIEILRKLFIIFIIDFIIIYKKRRN